MVTRTLIEGLPTNDPNVTLQVYCVSGGIPIDCDEPGGPGELPHKSPQSEDYWEFSYGGGPMPTRRFCLKHGPIHLAKMRNRRRA